MIALLKTAKYRPCHFPSRGEGIEIELKDIWHKQAQSRLFKPIQDPPRGGIKKGHSSYEKRLQKNHKKLAGLSLRRINRWKSSLKIT